MERRSSERFPAKLQARLFYGNMVYTGLVTNISESGMFISTKMSFPVDSVLISMVRSGAIVLKFAIKIRRTIKPEDHSINPETCGLGVQLLNPSDEYLEFVSNTRNRNLFK